jgi:hypothetical protein
MRQGKISLQPRNFILRISSKRLDELHSLTPFIDKITDKS